MRDGNRAMASPSCEMVSNAHGEKLGRWQLLSGSWLGLEQAFIQVNG